MPNYDYRCEKCGHVFEVFQKMSDAKLEDCPQEGCSGKVKRLLGSGFYQTDYRRDFHKKDISTNSETPKVGKTGITTANVSANIAQVASIALNDPEPASHTSTAEPTLPAEEYSEETETPSDNNPALTVLWWIMGIAVLLFVLFVVVPYVLFVAIPFLFDLVIGAFKFFLSLGQQAVEYDNKQVSSGSDKAWYIRIFTNPWAIGIMVLMLLGSFNSKN